MITNINKIKGLIDRDQKRKIPLVLLLMAIGAILETLSVSMLVPMISIIMDTESVQKNNVKIFFCTFRYHISQDTPVMSGRGYRINFTRTVFINHMSFI